MLVILRHLGEIELPNVLKKATVVNPSENLLPPAVKQVSQL
jgi:hypothetical protein